MNISIIIIHWNTPDFLDKQLEVLTKSGSFEIIVADNASDKPIAPIENKFSHVKFIKIRSNRGFASACNKGAQKAKGEWLFFLNPDVEIEADEIDKMLHLTIQKSLDATSPLPTSESYYKPLPSTWSLLAEFTSLKYLLPLNLFKQKTLTGGCLLIKTEVFKNLGGFDERFFLWFEDSDLTKRLIDAGYKVGWVGIEFKHLGGASFKYQNGQIYRDIFFNSMAVYAKKHFSRPGNLIIQIIKSHYTKRKLLPKLQNGVSIIIPNLKRELLNHFLEKNITFFDDDTEVIVVSSALNHHNVWDYRKKYPKVRFITIYKNEGFAETVNIGFRVSTTKWIGTINDDVVLNKDWIKNCLKLATEKTGSINPLIYKSARVLESAGINVLPRGKAVPIISYDKNQMCFETDATNAAAVLYNNDALNNVGLFDERFGSYLEDLDLSLRLKRAGWKNIIVLNASVIHQGQQTSKTLGKYKNWLDFKNWIYLILKNWGPRQLIINAPAIFVERLRNLSGVIKN